MRRVMIITADEADSHVLHKYEIERDRSPNRGDWIISYNLKHLLAENYHFFVYEGYVEDYWISER